MASRCLPRGPRWCFCWTGSVRPCTTHPVTPLTECHQRPLDATTRQGLAFFAQIGTTPDAEDWHQWEQFRQRIKGAR